ncbi:preprotein translocase subunit SecY [Weissella soli]|uniref:Protein translocase subunit SecY n=1 Tax=Weissella soli TaxID=155866 RepID=A0A288Q5A3_9LACO|nr:preprotein translocase subunit SecY [Weissella soli]AOT55769.1 Protein translocase subunit SecY [Weissella soli]MCT8394405.1 preprotein translocase subunit SecY [Weissella soli]NKY83582.1 preprotein translocase subunit SecY [Weissella soli]QEA35296.1 preprotein translocase subunit SecY [Weissella soli]RDL06557.1 protein translocase subunit secY/sec61 alpha [Weissella soli]
MLTTVLNSLKEKDIRKKLFFTLMILIVYRLGAYITVPGINPAALSEVANSGLGSILNMFSGGGLTNYSLFAMGVSPYVTAQIVVQLLQMDIVPRFVEWSKQGEVGRRKLNQVTRYLTIVLAFVQSIGITAGFNQLSQVQLVSTPNWQTYLLIGFLLTSGTMFAVWLGEMITERGLGQGVSMLIFAGIIARVPAGVVQLVKENVFQSSDQTRGWALVIGLMLIFLIVIAFVTWFNQAIRKIPMQYTRRSVGSGDSSYLPLKINVAGVIPVIFASSLLVTPQTILQAFSSKYGTTNWYTTLMDWLSMQTIQGGLLYTLLIVLFTFFYAFVQVNPEKVAENLQKQGSYIVGVWPGPATEKWLSGLLVRLSVVGALFLGFVALAPILATHYFGLDSNLGMSGTSLLIVIGVAIDLIRQLEGLMMKRQYVGFIQEGAKTK